MQLTQRKIDEIPWTTLGVLLMHDAGIDVRKKLSVSTYYKHKRILEAHGFELSYTTPNDKNRHK